MEDTVISTDLRNESDQRESGSLINVENPNAEEHVEANSAQIYNPLDISYRESVKAKKLGTNDVLPQGANRENYIQRQQADMLNRYSNDTVYSEKRLLNTLKEIINTVLKVNPYIKGDSYSTSAQYEYYFWSILSTYSSELIQLHKLAHSENPSKKIRENIRYIDNYYNHLINAPEKPKEADNKGLNRVKHANSLNLTALTTLDRSVDNTLAADLKQGVWEIDHYLLDSCDETGLSKLGTNTKLPFVLQLLGHSVRERLMVYYAVESGLKGTFTSMDISFSQRDYVPKLENFKSKFKKGSGFLWLRRAKGEHLDWEAVSGALRQVPRFHEDLKACSDEDEKLLQKRVDNEREEHEAGTTLMTKSNSQEIESDRKEYFNLDEGLKEKITMISGDSEEAILKKLANFYIENQNLISNLEGNSELKDNLIAFSDTIGVSLQKYAELENYIREIRSSFEEFDNSKLRYKDYLAIWQNNTKDKNREAVDSAREEMQKKGRQIAKLYTTIKNISESDLQSIEEINTLAGTIISQIDEASPTLNSDAGVIASNIKIKLLDTGFLQIFNIKEFIEGKSGFGTTDSISQEGDEESIVDAIAEGMEDFGSIAEVSKIAPGITVEKGINKVASNWSFGILSGITGLAAIAGIVSSISEFKELTADAIKSTSDFLGIFGSLSDLGVSGGDAVNSIATALSSEGVAEVAEKVGEKAGIVAATIGLATFTLDAASTTKQGLNVSSTREKLQKRRDRRGNAQGEEIENDHLEDVMTNLASRQVATRGVGLAYSAVKTALLTAAVFDADPITKTLLYFGAGAVEIIGAIHGAIRRRNDRRDTIDEFLGLDDIVRSDLTTNGNTEEANDSSSKLFKKVKEDLRNNFMASVGVSSEAEMHKLISLAGANYIYERISQVNDNGTIRPRFETDEIDDSPYFDMVKALGLKLSFPSEKEYREIEDDVNLTRAQKNQILLELVKPSRDTILAKMMGG